MSYSYAYLGILSYAMPSCLNEIYRVWTIEFIFFGESYKEKDTVIFYSYVRGYGQRWLWAHHKYWYFIGCDWDDEKKIWVHTSAKMYLIDDIVLFICIVCYFLTNFKGPKLLTYASSMNLNRLADGCQGYEPFSRWILWRCYW